MNQNTSALPFEIVDVFAENRYEGNQLAVIDSAGQLSTDMMQRIALETNFSETTFVCGGNSDSGFHVRIFTPTFELPFAGHPTLGTASVLRKKYAPDANRILLHLPKATIPVRFENDLAWLKAPPIQCGTTYDTESLSDVLNVDKLNFHPKYPIQHCCSGPHFTVVPMASLEALESFQPDVAHLANLRDRDMPDVLYLVALDARDARQTITVRTFFESNGVREDAATGSAVACLGAYLLEHQVMRSSVLDVKVSQGTSVGRPSVLHLHATKEIIEVGGQVIPIANGQWTL